MRGHVEVVKALLQARPVRAAAPPPLK